MQINTPAEIRQLETLLQQKLIPWMQNGAPFVLFDTPPSSLKPLNIVEQTVPPLAPLTQATVYPHIQGWLEAGVNSIDAPVLGCVFEGEADYRVQRPPGEPGQRWIVPLKEGTFFFIPPGIPFSGNALAWERPGIERAYARTVLIHLRRDGVSCLSYTLDKGKLWIHPYIILHEFESQFLAHRLLREFRTTEHRSQTIIFYYCLLIFHLMLRSIQELRHTSMRSIFRNSAASHNKLLLSQLAGPKDKVNLAQEYISEHLDDPDLSCKDITLHVNLSERHLNRLFGQETGMPLFQYVQQQRLERARILLASPGIPVGQVAQYCGFRQPSNFSSWFSRQQGCSPSEYRTRAQKFGRG